MISVNVLRRMRVTTRLVAGFLILALCVVAIWVAAVWSASVTRATAESLARAQAQLEAAHQLKFRVTDVSGWQAGYASRSSAAADATADTAPERAAFLKSRPASSPRSTPWPRCRSTGPNGRTWR